MKINEVRSVPTSEYSQSFLQGMVDRMSMSYFKYGKAADAYPHKVDALRSMQTRLDRYADDGNTEHLIDAANFLMIEFMHPKHKLAHYSPRDSGVSPGRQWHGEIDRSSRGNREI